MTENTIEMCPYCENEGDYSDIPQGGMITECKYCGRPILLCDRCKDHSDCGDCPYFGRMEKLMGEWEAKMVGQIVYWHDPDDDKCSNYCVVKSFSDHCYVLNPVEVDEWGGWHILEDSIVEAYDYEVERIPEERQRELKGKWRGN